jgi:hypothetical protein
MSLANEIGVATMKIAPAGAVIWASISGWGPQQWMYVTTIGYILFQAAYLGWKWRKEAMPKGRSAR